MICRSLIAAVVCASQLTGCSYGAIATTPDGSKVVITRQDGFLFGALRKVFVCQVTDTGVANCAAGETP